MAGIEGVTVDKGDPGSHADLVGRFDPVATLLHLLEARVRVLSRSARASDLASSARKVFENRDSFEILFNRAMLAMGLPILSDYPIQVRSIAERHCRELINREDIWASVAWCLNQGRACVSIRRFGTLCGIIATCVSLLDACAQFAIECAGVVVEDGKTDLRGRSGEEAVENSSPPPRSIPSSKAETTVTPSVPDRKGSKSAARKENKHGENDG